MGLKDDGFVGSESLLLSCLEASIPSFDVVRSRLLDLRRLWTFESS